MRCFVMFVTAVCTFFLLTLKWPGNKSFYKTEENREKDFPIFKAARVAKKIWRMINLVPRASFPLTSGRKTRALRASIVNDIPVGTADGLDGIPTSLLKLSFTFIASSLTHIFNLVFSNGIIPNDWKSARVTPIYIAD